MKKITPQDVHLELVFLGSLPETVEEEPARSAYDERIRAAQADGKKVLFVCCAHHREQLRGALHIGSTWDELQAMNDFYRGHKHMPGSSPNWTAEHTVESIIALADDLSSDELRRHFTAGIVSEITGSRSRHARERIRFSRLWEERLSSDMPRHEDALHVEPRPSVAALALKIWFLIRDGVEDGFSLPKATNWALQNGNADGSDLYKTLSYLKTGKGNEKHNPWRDRKHLERAIALLKAEKQFGAVALAEKELRERKWGK